DLVARFRVNTDHAGQGEQGQSTLQRQRLRVHATCQARALGLGGLALGIRPALAKLDIDAVGATPQRDVLASCRVDTQLLLPAREAAAFRLALAAGYGQRAGVAALRVVGAADEGAVAAQPQPQPAIGAGGAGARIAAIF